MKEDPEIQEEVADIDLAVAIEDVRWLEVLPDLEALCAEVVDLVLSDLEYAPSSPMEVACVFIHDAAIRDLNAEYRQKDTPTNVLSFPADDMLLPGMPLILGDIFLSFETIGREALEQGKPFRDHTVHMLVHGLLHLLGFDHEQDEDAEEMEAREVALLAALGIENPYIPAFPPPQNRTVH